MKIIMPKNILEQLFRKLVLLIKCLEQKLEM